MARKKKTELQVVSTKEDNILLEEKVDGNKIKEELEKYVDEKINKTFIDELDKSNRRLLREKSRKIIVKNIVILILLAIIGFLIYLLFSNNYFESNDSLNVFARVGYTQEAGSTTGRKVYLKDNTFKHTGTGYFYPIKCATGSANNDTLYVSGNTTNTTQSRTLINTDLKNKDIAESNFATISYTYNY